MVSEKRVMCDYCARWEPKEKMVPLYEKGNEHVMYYCPRCIDTAKEAIRKLPFYKLFRFGEQGKF